jgi:hypothetical protein
LAADVVALRIRQPGLLQTNRHARADLAALADSRPRRAPDRGQWPSPVAEAVEPYVVTHTETHPAWGYRKAWALTCHDGHRVSPATTLRIMRHRGLLQPDGYTRERR